MFRSFCRMLTLTALVAGLAATSIASDRDSSERLTLQTTDEQIAREITHAIRLYSGYEIFDWIDGNVRDGEVTLSGAVRVPQSKVDYTSLVKKIPGVKGIRNEIQVSPVSRFDDEIRVAAALSIYRDPLFRQYAIQARPPIHILVENGKIELRGIVGTAVEKRVAEDRARNSSIAFAVTNNLELESAN